MVFNFSRGLPVFMKDRRSHLAGVYRILSATVSATFLVTSAFADGARTSMGGDARWYACEAAAHCQWTIGEGGWPVAVRADSAQEYHHWVKSQAPFTSYFTPGDCFKSDDEFQAFALESRSRMLCTDRRCTLDVAPSCTK